MPERIKIGRDPEMWNSISQAGLTDLDSERVCGVIQNVREAVMRRLDVLLKQSATSSECESAASAIGTLSQLGRRVRQGAKRTARSDWSSPKLRRD